MGSVALLWRNIKCNVNPGLSYFERYMVACAGFLANLHLHFTFCQSRQSKATLPWFWVTRFWIVPVLYRWILPLLCFYGIWYYYIFLLNFFLLSFTASTFWANDAFSPTESRENKNEEKMIEDTIFSRLQEFLKHADWPIYIPRWKKQYGHWARKLGFFCSTQKWCSSLFQFSDGYLHSVSRKWEPQAMVKREILFGCCVHWWIFQKWNVVQTLI